MTLFDEKSCTNFSCPKLISLEPSEQNNTEEGEHRVLINIIKNKSQFCSLPVFLKQAVPRAAQLMKPGCLWIRVSRLNSLMSNEVQALIKVFPHRWGIHNNALIWEHTHPPGLHRMSCCLLLPTAPSQPPHQSCLHQTHNLWVQSGWKNIPATHTEPQGSCFPKTPAWKSLPEASQAVMLQGGHSSSQEKGMRKQ